jgi:plastocyanin
MTGRLALLAASAALAAAGLTAAGTSGADDPDARAAAKSVQVRDNSFSPARFSARRRELVTFTWVGANRHNVRGTSGQRFNSGFNGKTRGRFRIRVKARRGKRIRFVCDFHPTTMRGSIRVR